MKLGKVIEEYRIKNEFSLRDFAKMCNCSHAHIATLERGYDTRNGKEIVPDNEDFITMSKVMDIPVNELIKKCDYEVKFSEYTLLIIGSIRYLELLFEEQKLTIEEKIDKINDMIDGLNSYIYSMNMQKEMLLKDDLNKIIQKDRINDIEKETFINKVRINGLRQILEKIEEINKKAHSESETLIIKAKRRSKR